MSVQTPARTAIFISHANPEDNEFTVWLGAHLSGAGYEVWGDVLKLKGGQDWARKLEDALRNRTCKMLLVGSRAGVDKQGVRNEIQIASDLAKKLKDFEFIIPLRREDYDPPFQIVQAQYIDFMKGWGEGLAELLKTLEAYNVPRSISFNSECISNYRDIQLLKARTVEPRPEELISNWIRISEWPQTIHYFSFKSSLRDEHAKELLAKCSWPTYLFQKGFITFAGEADFSSDPEGFWPPIVLEKKWWVAHFLKHGDNDLRINSKEVRNIISHFTRAALEQHFLNKKLSRYYYSAGAVGWWVPTGLIPEDKVTYSWGDDLSGRRQMVGEVRAGIQKYKWHFGISAKPWISGNPNVRFIPRVIFSLDGQTPIEDVKHMHRLRRSITRSWRNERWRDLLLAFLFWLAGGNRKLILTTGSNCGITLDFPPILMTSPISIHAENGELLEEGDIDTEDPVYAVDVEGLEKGDDEA